MNILGLGGYSHDAAAALICDGKVVAACAEERFTRNKHQGGAPLRAIAWCLEQAGLRPSDVGHASAYMRPGYSGYELYHNIQYVRDVRRALPDGARVHFMEHHPAHAASAFLCSPFERAALMSIDYIGEWDATWTGLGEGTSIKKLSAQHYPHSLGVFYTALTDYLGFRRASDEYKVMGLASYGEPEHLDEFRQVILRTGPGRYRLDLSWFVCHYKPGSLHGYFSERFEQRFGRKRQQGEPIEERHANIAASAQAVLEEVVLDMAATLHRETGTTALCLAGGVALNCSMNGRLLRESPFERIYVQPAAGDDGIAIGGALQLHHRLTSAPRGPAMDHAYLGPEYSAATIQQFLEMAKIPYSKPEPLHEAAAELLAEGLIVGWYQGRMEFGPRALGARSILADPTRPEMKDHLNQYVKHREEFRPFAPAVLRERAHEFFEGCTDAPFMLFVYPVKKAMQERIPAVTHVDGTARVQTVTRDAHPLYYDTIAAFEKRRGVPVILNTSFNVMGEPIVDTPEQAVRCFFSTGMDALVLGPYIVRKR